MHTNYYNTIDISFIDEFLNIVKNNNKMYIHHSKLIDYGIMTSTRSNDIKEKLNNLRMIENIDFTLRDVSQRGKKRFLNT